MLRGRIRIGVDSRFDKVHPLSVTIRRCVSEKGEDGCPNSRETFWYVRVSLIWYIDFPRTQQQSRVSVWTMSVMGMPCWSIFEHWNNSPSVSISVKSLHLAISHSKRETSDPFGWFSFCVYTYTVSICRPGYTALTLNGVPAGMLLWSYRWVMKLQ